MEIPGRNQGMIVRLGTFPRVASISATLLATLLAITAIQQAQAQFVFTSTKLIDSFESTTDIDRYLSTADATYIAHQQTVAGATRGANALQLETEGGFALNNGTPEFMGWGAIGGLSIAGDYTSADTAAYDAFQLAALNPDAWDLLYDVSSDANSWIEAPSTTTSTSMPGDIGPDRSGARIQLNYDGIPGTPFNTSSFYGATGTTTVKVPFRNLFSSTTPLPTTGASTYTLSFGADINRFNPEDPAPNGGAKHYIDNVRLKPKSPVVGDVVWDFETDAATFQGWSDKGNSGVNMSYKNHIVTGLGATKLNSTTGKFEPDPVGQALFIDTSNATGGFTTGEAMILNSDTDNNGVIDNAGVDAKLRNVITRLRKAEAIQFDITFHDSLVPPVGLPAAVVPGEANASFIKVVMQINVDSTPANGVGGGGLTQFQYDNEFGVDALGNNIQISRGDYAALLTTEFTPDGLAPDEPLTMTYPIAQLGTLQSQLQSALFTNTNYLRITLILQASGGSQTILGVIDNIRFLQTQSLDGDFQHDGDVDAADLAVWRANLGPTNAIGDADDDGDTDGDDFLIWQRNLGNDANGAAPAGSVPEPGAALLAAFGMISARAMRRRSRH
jgi:hypothetical protein